VSPDSSVVIVTGYGLDGLGLITGRGKKFVSIPHCPDRLWGTPSFLLNGYWGVKLPEHEAEHWPPYSTETKSGGYIPPLSHMFHGILLNSLSTDFTLT
jgi:hypothetical protein